jgi:hypothetical protein
MDWVGNYGHEVALPYNYVSKRECMNIFEIQISVWNTGRKDWNCTRFRSRWSLAAGFTLSHV